MTKTTKHDPRFKLRSWRVEIEGYGSGHVIASSQGKALSDTWKSDTFNNLSYGEFMKISKAFKAEDKAGFGDPITLSGTPAFFVSRNKTGVMVALPFDTHISRAHPSEVLPERYRPEQYRSDYLTKMQEERESTSGKSRPIGFFQKAKRFFLRR